MKKILLFVITILLVGCGCEKKNEVKEIYISFSERNTNINYNIDGTQESHINLGNTSTLIIETNSKGDIDMNKVLCTSSNLSVAEIRSDKTIIPKSVGKTDLQCKYNDIKSNQLSLEIKEG